MMSVIKLGFDDIVSVRLSCDGMAHETITKNDNYVTYTYETVDLKLEVVRKVRDNEQSRTMCQNN